MISRIATDQDFTFAPIASVGLRGTIAPASESARTTSYVARWDAEWLPHFFTSVEYQHQDFGGLSYEVPSTEITIEGGAAELLVLPAHLHPRGAPVLPAPHPRGDPLEVGDRHPVDGEPGAPVRHRGR